MNSKLTSSTQALQQTATTSNPRANSVTANRNRMPGGKRGNRNRKLQSCCVIYVGTENCKNSCRIYVGSPPHNTTTNTRHTAPHQTTTNHNQPPTTTTHQHQPTATTNQANQANQVAQATLRARSCLVARAQVRSLLPARVPYWRHRATSSASQQASKPASQ